MQKQREEFNKVMKVLEADGYKDIVREFSQFFLKDVFEKLLVTVHTNNERAVIIMPPVAEKITIYIRDYTKGVNVRYIGESKEETE